jgi:hypothetical protein
MVNLSSTPSKNVGSLLGICHVGFSNQGIGPSARCPLQGSCLPCRAYFLYSSSSAPCVEAQVVLCVLLPALQLYSHLSPGCSLIRTCSSSCIYAIFLTLCFPCLAHSSALKMNAVCPSEMSVNFYQTVQSHVPKDNYSSVIVVSMCGMFWSVFMILWLR